MIREWHGNDTATRKDSTFWHYYLCFPEFWPTRPQCNGTIYGRTLTTYHKFYSMRPLPAQPLNVCIASATFSHNEKLLTAYRNKKARLASATHELLIYAWGIVCSQLSARLLSGVNMTGGFAVGLVTHDRTGWSQLILMALWFVDWWISYEYS